MSGVMAVNSNSRSSIYSIQIDPSVDSEFDAEKSTPAPNATTHEAKGVNAGLNDPPRAEWKDDGDIVITFHQKASGIDQKLPRVASASAA